LQETPKASTPVYRAATDDDEDGIWTVLQEVAPEVPVLLDTPERQEAIQGIIGDCCAGGDSLVAVDANGTVVGFVLAKPDRLERFFKRNQALSLRYVGVSKALRRQGIFGCLMEASKAKGVPLTASGALPWFESYADQDWITKMLLRHTG
jgi:predicted N-acetyltransferase YhbS